MPVSGVMEVRRGRFESEQMREGEVGVTVGDGVAAMTTVGGGVGARVLVPPLSINDEPLAPVADVSGAAVAVSPPAPVPAPPVPDVAVAGSVADVAAAPVVAPVSVPVASVAELVLVPAATPVPSPATPYELLLEIPVSPVVSLRVVLMLVRVTLVSGRVVLRIVDVIFRNVSSNAAVMFPNVVLDWVRLCQTVVFIRVVVRLAR